MNNGPDRERRCIVAWISGEVANALRSSGIVLSPLLLPSLWHLAPLRLDVCVAARLLTGSSLEASARVLGTALLFTASVGVAGAGRIIMQGQLFACFLIGLHFWFCRVDIRGREFISAKVRT